MIETYRMLGEAHDAEFERQGRTLRSAAAIRKARRAAEPGATAPMLPTALRVTVTKLTALVR